MHLCNIFQIAESLSTTSIEIITSAAICFEYLYNRFSGLLGQLIGFRLYSAQGIYRVWGLGRLGFIGPIR